MQIHLAKMPFLIVLLIKDFVENWEFRNMEDLTKERIKEASPILYCSLDMFHPQRRTEL